MRLFVFLILGLIGQSLCAVPTGSMIRRELQKADAYPLWIPESARLALESAISFELKGDHERDDEVYSSLVGVFSSFYMKNAEEFTGLCDDVRTLAECKPLLWDKTKALMAQKIHLAVTDSVNELLFLKDNPYFNEKSIPHSRVLASLGMGEGEKIAGLLSSKTQEFNVGGFRPSLFNRNPHYAQTVGLLGEMDPSFMSALMLGKGDSAKLFGKRLSRARAIFEMEWSLFGKNVLFPHALLGAMQKASGRAFLLGKELSLRKASLVGLGVCTQAPARVTRSPELYLFCQFLHQNT